MKHSFFPSQFRFIFSAAIFLGILSVLIHPLQAQEQNRLTGLDAYVEKAMDTWEVPGLAIAVVKDDRVVLAKGYGVKEINQEAPVNEHTLFAIASNTKAFTATALGLLVQEGEIRWDDPVLKYLPDFQLYDPVATRKLIVRDLLCHRVGLATWGGDLTWYKSNYDKEEVIRRIRFQKPVYDFRTGYGYCNLMFLVAGEIIPEVTDLSWSRFIKQRFFKPLGMNRSNTSVTDLEGMENVATPHMIYDGEVVPMPYVNVDNAPPPGAINSSVHDLAQWLRMQLATGVYNGQQLVDTTIIRETRQPHNLLRVSEQAKKLNPDTHFLTYGLGWFLRDYQGRLLVYHTGGLDGMFSYLGFMPEEKLGVVVLTNREDHNLMRALAYHLYDAYLERDFQDWSRRYLEQHRQDKLEEKQRAEKHKKARNPDTTPTHRLESYTGAYTSRLYGNAQVFLESGKLNMRLLAHPQITGTLEHWEYNIFRCQWSSKVWDNSFIYFDLGDDGKIAQFRVKIRPDWIDTLEYVFEKNF